MENKKTCDFGVVQIFFILQRNGRVIFSCVLAGMVLSIFTGLMMTPKFIATARVMPPQMQGVTSGNIAGQLNAFSAAAITIPGLKNPNDLYIGILNSQSISDGLISKFKLRERFEAKTMVATRKILASISDINSGKDGLINISVESDDPKFAAILANGYIDQLKNVMSSLAVTDASRRRVFFEGQLRDVQKNLMQTEQKFKVMQEKSGLVQAEGQLSAIVANVAQLKTTITAKEVELASMRAYASLDHPDVQRLKIEIGSLKEKLKNYEVGESGVSSDSFILPAGNIPTVGLDYIRGMRDVKYQEAMFEMLSKQYELAKIDEAKDVSLIQVLDVAIPPDQKSKPSRTLILGFGIVLGLFVGVIASYIREFLSRNSKKWEQSTIAWQGRL